VNRYQVFHSPVEHLRKNIHVVLVRPEQGRNVGAAARALANMGINGDWRIVGTSEIVDQDCRRVAKHARDRLERIQYFPTLADALGPQSERRGLTLAATARIGSPNRPHPLRVRTAMERAIHKLRSAEAGELTIVFGPESDGLRNEEIDLCDWVVTIPSTHEYRSLNLAQSLLIFCYEANHCLMEDWANADSSEEKSRLTQREKLIAHILRLAEAVGFVLPGDPFKMKPRLEEILARLPNHIKDVKTLHGLLDQTIRSVEKGRPDFKGRFKNFVEEEPRV
jgi:tRNA/rRNA methyltransferase